MGVFSYHIVKLPMLSALKFILFKKKTAVNGLIHAETMTVMKLGSPMYFPSRFFSRKLVFFAQWEHEKAIDDFLESDPFGKELAGGWHVRLDFIRQWGTISGFEIPDIEEKIAASDPVVAVTIARMKYLEIPRFIKWGRPVEKLVRDHSGTTLSLASVRYPNVVSTFSIWKAQQEMTDMVRGHSQMPRPERHADAMKEMDRKNFHFEFTTLRFKPISESGTWNNIADFIPKNR